ncbi:transglycosylase SLT domain-containing protein [Sneathia sanguinegens]|uniref:transglycosylase SLT domain-containing protein n=1 Tax=Sneathia sanguinegens TaxID=40543 RepID=UPI00288951B6|nr:transglycosylase SLT domain-containing protein [Sneathia sanguinegens]
MKKIILLIIGFLSTICISFASVSEYDNLIDKNTSNQSERTILKYIMRMESMGNSNAKNPGSSATGAWQMIDGTWGQAVSEGKKQGLFTSKEANYLLAHPEMRKNPEYSTKAALALLRYGRKMGGDTAIKQILAYHDGSVRKPFDSLKLEAKQYAIKANEMYKLQNGGKNMPGFDEYVKNSKTYQKWLRDGTVAKIQKDAKSRLNGKYSMENGEITESELNDGAAVKINFKPTHKLSLDEFAKTIQGYILTGVKKAAPLAIFITSILFGIQIMMDLLFGITSNNLGVVLKGVFFKRAIGFVFYLFIIRKIASGELMEMVRKMASGVLVAFIGTEIKNPLDNAWALKELVSQTILEAIIKTWSSISYLNLFSLSQSIQQALILTIILILFWIFIAFAFFRMIFDLLKLVISLDLGMGIATLLMGLGMTDATRQYYSIGKILSMAINFVLKFAAINLFFLIGVNILTTSAKIIDKNPITQIGGNIFTNPLIKYLLLVFVVYKLVTEVKVEF